MCGDDDEGKIKTYVGAPGTDDGRSCTDIQCLLLFIVFWIGFIVIASIGFANGDPERLLYGTDYLGYVCGRTGFKGRTGPPNFTRVFDGTAPTNSSPWQSSVWTENQFLWYPITINASGSASEVFKHGVCVKACPVIPENITGNLTFQSFILGESNSSEISEMLRWLTIYTYGNVTYNGFRTFEPATRFAIYNSKEFYRRCYPGTNNSGAVAEAVQAIPGGTGASNFFFKGIIEVQACWRIYLIIAAIALVLCFIYIMIMKCVVEPITWITLFGVLIILGVCTYLCWRQRELIKQQNPDPKDPDLTKYEEYYLAAFIIFAILTFLWLLFLFFFYDKIKEALQVMKVAVRVLNASPFIVFWPPIIAVFVIALFFWCIYVAIYLYTSDSFVEGTSKLVAVPNNDTSRLSNDTQYVVINNTAYVNVTSGELQKDTAKRDMLFYDLFGFLWTMGFFNAIGFMVIAFHAIVWYFSSLVDAEKEIPIGTFPKVLCWTMFFHLGTLAFGSLLVAIVQFLRFILWYVSKQCEIVKENEAVKCIISIADCCLAYFEKIVKIISKNGFIVTGITNQWFLCAAKRAAGILLDNAGAASVLMVLSEIVTFIGKLLIVVGCVALSYYMMDYESLAPGVEIKVFPLILIAFLIYFVASTFFNVYTTAIDAVFICYHHDRIANESTGCYHTPEELAQLIEGYDQQKATARYQASQEAKTAGAEAKGEESGEPKKE